MGSRVGSSTCTTKISNPSLTALRPLVECSRVAGRCSRSLTVVSVRAPPQAQTLEILLAGTDLVGRARTGCGKTLAFVLPIVQTLTGDAAPGGRRPFGRAPAVIVLAPTRELAKQVRRKWSGAMRPHSCRHASCSSVRV